MSSQHKLSARLFAGVAILYLLCAAGYIDTVDAEPSIQTARALLEHSSFRISPPQLEAKYYFLTPKGYIYSKLGLVMPILYMPCIVAAKLISIAPGDETLLIRFFVSLVNAFVTAAIVAALFIFFQYQVNPPRSALTVALIAAFATYLFPYSKACGREPVQALCLLLCFITPMLAQRMKRPMLGYLLCGLVSSIGLLTKQAFLVPWIPAAGFAVFSAIRSPQPKRHLTALILPLGICLVAWFSFAKIALGGFLETGYHLNTIFFRYDSWPTPFLEGVFCQLLSSNSGFFFYNPILILSVIAVGAKLLYSTRSECAHFWRRIFERNEEGETKARIVTASSIYRGFGIFDLCLCFSIVFQVCFYAKWTSPAGMDALGPRYLVVVAPLFILLWHPLPMQWPRKPTAALVSLLLAWSFFLQIVHVSVKPQQYTSLKTLAGEDLPTPHWIANLTFFRHKWRGKGEIYRLSDFGSQRTNKIDLSRFYTLVGFNYWWLHAKKLETGSDRKEKPLPKSIPIAQMNHGG